ncbi:MAG TPA: PEP-CTERM sorting domain-containing protein [Phycisphaerae bacterium]|nr:PEP-CTERM sorting domain-containing protein [Phycisphaerae bacterium]
MIRKSIIVVAVAALFCIASSARATLLAEWTFETSIPTTAGPHAAEGGLNAGGGSPASGLHASGATAYSNPVGNATVESFSSTNWAVGDYWQFCTATNTGLGYEDIIFSWDQVSSNTGPRDFELQYNVNGGGYTTFGSTYVVLANAAPNNWASGGPYVAATHYSVDLSSVAALNNAASICIRLVNNSTVSANGSTVAGTGTDRVDTVQVNATEVPEPTTLALLGLGALGMIRRRR